MSLWRPRGQCGAHTSSINQFTRTGKMGGQPQGNSNQLTGNGRGWWVDQTSFDGLHADGCASRERFRGGGTGFRVHSGGAVHGDDIWCGRGCPTMSQQTGLIGSEWEADPGAQQAIQNNGGRSEPGIELCKIGVGRQDGHLTTD